MGVGSNGVAEAGTVPNGLTRAGVIDANVQEWLGVHLQGSIRVAEAWDQITHSGSWSGWECSGAHGREKGAQGQKEKYSSLLPKREWERRQNS